jgi:hypothetical protein
MNLGANLDVTAFINTWVNWAIQEVWNDRLWDFRRRALAPLTVNVNESDVDLPANFDQPENFQILTPVTKANRIWPYPEYILKYFIPDPTSVSNGTPGTPVVWLPPIGYDGTTYNLRFYPPADQTYTIGGDYFIIHPDLNSGDVTLIPPQWDKVIVARAIVYIREYEDETTIAPWERAFEKELLKMRNALNRKSGQLPRWMHEKEVRYLATRGVANDRDIR